MKVVKVYGALRKRLGQCRFQFEADTPAQAIKALCANFPGLDKWLIDSEQDGVGYRVTIGKERIGGDDVSPMLMPWSEHEVFSITPVIAGAGQGMGQIFAGIGLIALSFLLPGAGIFGATSLFGATAATTGVAGFATALGTAFSVAGASLILGGVAQMLSPTPTFSGLERGKEAARLESFSFSSIVNTTQQGMPVPVCYGRAYVGSAVISSGLDVDQS
jgi:predicted phage tail protein